MFGLCTDKKETVIADQLLISETREDSRRNISSSVDPFVLSSISQNSSLSAAKILELDARRCSGCRNRGGTIAFTTMQTHLCAGIRVRQDVHNQPRGDERLLAR
jgi:hypothetical protein